MVQNKVQKWNGSIRWYSDATLETDMLDLTCGTRWRIQPWTYTLWLHMDGWSRTEHLTSFGTVKLIIVRTIKDRVLSLTKGCKCKTGCATNRCSCRWSGNICSVGCECTNCVNIPPCYSSIDWGRIHHWRNDGTCIQPESNTIATQRASVTQRTLWWATVCTAHKRAIRLPLSNPESTSDAEDSMEL